MNRIAESLKTFIAIRRSNDRLMQAVRADVQNYGLNINEFAVLEILFHKGPQTVQQIKERILIANSSTTYIIDKLCEKEMVWRERDGEDKRIIFVSITEKGKRLVEEVFPKHEQLITSLYDELDDDELLELKRLLKKMNRYKSKEKLEDESR